MTTKLDQFNNRYKNKKQQNDISKIFLVVVLVGLVSVGVYNVWKKYGPKHIVVQYVSYGLEANTKIKIGDEAEPEKGILDLNPSSKDDWNKAIEHERNGNYNEALGLFELISSLNPNFNASLYHTTFCRLQAKDLDSHKLSAITSGIALLKSNLGRSSSFLFLEGVLEYRQGHLKEAMETFANVVEKSPQYGKAYAYLGELQLLNNHSREAVNSFKTAVSLWGSPKEKAYSGLALAYNNLGILDSCSEVVDFVLEMKPNYARAMRVKGYLSEYDGRYSEAEVLYKRILNVNPENEEALIALKTLGQKSVPNASSNSTYNGNRMSPQSIMNSMVEILEPLIKNHPENAPLKYALGMAYYNGRDFNKARVSFEEVLVLDSSYNGAQEMIEQSNNAENLEYISQDNSLDLLDSIKKMVTKTKMSSFERMGHYLVPWGSSKQKFLKKYDETRFEKLKDNNIRETFYEDTFFHEYIAMFDSSGFYGVHVTVKDTSFAEKSNLLFDLYGKFLKINSHISGIGSSTGESMCNSKDSLFQGVIWETQDNFEMLVQFAKHRDEVKMIRLSRTHVPTSLKLCDYMPFVAKY